MSQSHFVHTVADSGILGQTILFIGGGMKERNFSALLAVLALFYGVTPAITADTEISATAIAPTLRQQSDDDFDGGLIEKTEDAGGRPSGYNCYEYGKSVEISQEAFSTIPDEELSAEAG